MISYHDEGLLANLDIHKRRYRDSASSSTNHLDFDIKSVLERTIHPCRSESRYFVFPTFEEKSKEAQEEGKDEEQVEGQTDRVEEGEVEVNENDDIMETDDWFTSTQQDEVAENQGNDSSQDQQNEILIMFLKLKPEVLRGAYEKSWQNIHERIC